MSITIAAAMALTVSSLIMRMYRYIPFAILSVAYIYLTDQVILPSSLTEHSRLILQVSDIACLILVFVSILFIFLVNKDRGIKAILPLLLAIGLVVTRVLRWFIVDVPCNGLLSNLFNAAERAAELIQIQYRFTVVFTVFVICLYILNFLQIFQRNFHKS